MQFNLETVEGYIKDARTLLLDKIYPPRYDDNSLLVAFNLALQEGRRLRADLFVGRNGRLEVPSYDSVSGERVPIEPQFRRAFVYGIVGHALMRDQDDVQDQRSNTFLAAMQYLLTGASTRPPIAGGTPNTPTPRASGI